MIRVILKDFLNDIKNIKNLLTIDEWIITIILGIVLGVVLIGTFVYPY